jgi:Fe-S cluster assembly protein SufD
MLAPAKKLALRQEALAQWLAGRDLPAGKGWLGQARAAALSRAQAMGLPTRRDEYWRYTDPRALLSADLPDAPFRDTSDEGPVFDTIDRLKLVFVDGVFDAAASDPLELAGVEICTLAQAAGTDLHWARDLYGKLEARGQAPVERALATLNTAFAEQGLLMRVTGQAAKPIAISYRRGALQAQAMVHHVVKLEAGAELTLLETGPVAARALAVIEADIAEDAVLHHIRTNGRDHGRVSNSHLFAALGARAKLKSFGLTANGALTRHDAVVWLDGAQGSAHVAGATVGDGAFHNDDTVFITHGAPECESRQVFKKVLRHGAVGVFQGKILVKQIAQLTDGYQISQALLLDEDAQFLAKPELEIYADDVKCSHGSTSGEIDAAQLFYLRARGVPESEAKLLLVLSFLAEALEEIADPDLAEDLRGRIENWLKRHA